MNVDTNPLRDDGIPDFERLLRPDDSPIVWAAEATEQDIDRSVQTWAVSGLSTRILRGGHMRSANDAYAEMAAALQFPLYFGNNLMAVDELMTDLAWLPTESGWAFVIAHPEELLADEPEESFNLFVQVLTSAKSYWAKDVRYPGALPAGRLPMNLVIAASANLDAEVIRWRLAGCTPVRWRSLPVDSRAVGW